MREQTVGRQELREEHSGDDKETGDHLCKRLREGVEERQEETPGTNIVWR